MTAVRRVLAKSTLLKGMYHTVHAASLRATCAVSPELLGRLRYHAAWSCWPDLNRPVTFDEKLLWLNLYWRHPLKTECADKYLLRGYVERSGMQHLLPRVHAVYESADEINIDDLPVQFVLKCTHGCKCNVFCFSRQNFDVAAAQRSLSRWLAMNFSQVLGELHYAGMKPRVICEELLHEENGRLPTDYKVFCFNGRPRWILCCTGREPNEKGTRSVVDVEWKPAGILREQAGSPTRLAELPALLEAAETLSAPFPFVRVDFYCIRGRLVLGEMTFTPNACINRDYDQKTLGDQLQLPHPWRA
jgi:hypothetical protein